MSRLAFNRPNDTDRAVGLAHRPAAQEPAQGLKVLLAVDGTERTNALLDWVLRLAPIRSDLEVVVLSVQPEPRTGRLRGYGSFKHDQIRGRLIDDIGTRAVASAGGRLDRAGIRYKQRIELGDAAQTAMRCAAEEQCQMIVIGEPKPGAFRQWLIETTGIVFGSLASKVVQLADVPVVVVK